MNLISSITKAHSSSSPDDISLQASDVNTIMSGIKKREENVIELIDRSLKFQATSKKKDYTQLQSIQTQYSLNEMERKRRENDILKKYKDFKVEKKKHRKLVHKFCKRIIQLNNQVKRKLVELDIFEQVKANYERSKDCEAELKSLVRKETIELEEVLTFAVTNSRKSYEFAVEIIRNHEKASPQNYRRSVEPTPMIDENKILQQVRKRKASDFREAGGHQSVENKSESISHILESLKKERLTSSSVFAASNDVLGSEPSFNMSFKQNNDMNFRFSTESSSNYTGGKGPLMNWRGEENFEGAEIVSILKEKLKSCKNISEYRKEKEKEKAKLRSSSSTKNDLTLANPLPLFPLIKQSSLKVNNSQIITRKNRAVTEEDSAKEVAKEVVQVPNHVFVDLTKNDVLKHYEILKIESQNLVFAPKRGEARKMLLDKVFNDLLFMNQSIKRTTSTYYTETQEYQRKKNYAALSKSEFFGKPPSRKANSNTISLTTLKRGTRPLPVQSQTPAPVQVHVQETPHKFQTAQTAPTVHTIQTSQTIATVHTVHTIHTLHTEPPLKPRIELPKEKKVEVLRQDYQPNLGDSLNISEHVQLLKEGGSRGNMRSQHGARSLTRLDGSPPRKETSIKIIEFEVNLRGSSIDKKLRTPIVKDVSLKTKQLKQKLPTENLIRERKLIYEALNKNKQNIFVVPPYPQQNNNSVIKLKKDNPKTPGNPTITTQTNLSDLKAKNSTKSILAKINEEYYINQQLVNNRFV